MCCFHLKVTEIPSDRHSTILGTFNSWFDLLHQVENFLSPFTSLVHSHLLFMRVPNSPYANRNIVSLQTHATSGTVPKLLVEGSLRTSQTTSSCLAPCHATLCLALQGLFYSADR